MSRSLAAILVLVLCAGGGLLWLSKRAPKEVTDTTEAKPVATVRSALAKVQQIEETLDAIGEVTYAQSDGLSFTRAGQISELHLVVGDRVRKGATLATLVPDPAVRQGWQQALDTLGLAQRELARQGQLLASHLATQSQVDAATKALRDAEGAVKTLEELGGATNSSELTAPFDGVVSAVTALQGDRVVAGASVLQLGRDDRLRVLIGIEPAQRAHLRRGTQVTLRPMAGAGAETGSVECRLDDIQNMVDPKTQLISAVVMLPPNFSARLAPGMRVEARLRLGSVSGVAVPRNAVLTDEQGDYLFQVVDGQAHRVAVTRRLDNGVMVAIDGLADLKRPVVIEGNYELTDGMHVKDAQP